MWLTPFSMALYGANALRVPVVTITSSLASAMVPPPPPAEGHDGHLGEVSIEAPSAGQDGDHDQRVHTDPACQAGRRPIGGSVSAGADASSKCLTAVCSLDLLLKGITLSL